MKRALSFREWGSGAPLLFWPGLNPSAPAQLDEIAPAWAGRYGLRVLAAVPPGWGTGALEAAQYRPSALARLIAAELDRLGLERVTFVGWSWGASIGCHLAAQAPDRLRALGLLDAGYTDFQDRPDFREQSLEERTAALRDEPVRFESEETFLAAMRPRYRRWRPELAQRLRAGMREENGALTPIVSPEVIAAAAQGVIDERPSGTLAALGALELPILVVAASQTVAEDWGAAALARFMQAVPQAVVTPIESGHDVLADAPDAVAQTVGRWLAALPEV